MIINDEKWNEIFPLKRKLLQCEIYHLTVRTAGKLEPIRARDESGHHPVEGLIQKQTGVHTYGQFRVDT